uniref:Uncharacterized protein n=1 Tax=Plectus sambesii TaxID=2011161 RepID=A0A914WJZ9_9BILA
MSLGPPGHRLTSRRVSDRQSIGSVGRLRSGHRRRRRTVHHLICPLAVADCRRHFERPSVALVLLESSLLPPSPGPRRPWSSLDNRLPAAARSSICAYYAVALFYSLAAASVNSCVAQLLIQLMTTASADSFSQSADVRSEWRLPRGRRRRAGGSQVCRAGGQWRPMARIVFRRLFCAPVSRIVCSGSSSRSWSPGRHNAQGRLCGADDLHPEQGGLVACRLLDASLLAVDERGGARIRRSPADNGRHGRRLIWRNGRHSLRFAVIKWRRPAGRDLGGRPFPSRQNLCDVFARDRGPRIRRDLIRAAALIRKLMLRRVGLGRLAVGWPLDGRAGSKAVSPVGRRQEAVTRSPRVHSAVVVPFDPRHLPIVPVCRPESSPAGSLRRSSASKAASSIPAAVPSNASGLKAPQSRLQPPQTPKAVSAAVASPSSKIAPPSSSGKMLKLKFFGGKDKDKEKSPTPPSARSDAPAESNRTSNSSSGVSSAHSESLERSGDSVGSPKSSLKALAKRGLKAPSKSGAKSALVRPKEISGKVTGAGQQTSPQLLRKQRTPDSKLQLNRVSKSSEETDGDSAYAGFDSSSPTSSAALSETPMRLSPSSQTSNGSSSKLATPTKVDQRWSPIGAPSVKESVGSPQDGKPVLAVKGIAAPNSSKLAPPATTVLKPTCLVPKSSSRSSGLKMSTSTSTSDKLAQTRAPAKTQTGAPSPTVGVVSPMTHHRTLASQQSEGNQSDSNTSTTSGSRDSDSVSVIFNPSADAAGSSCAAKPPSGLKKPASAEKQRPPVPNRTSSRLETTFDSNDGAVTTETYSGTQSPSLEDAVKPMEPLVPRASPYAFLKGLPQSVNHKVPSTHRNHMTITRPIGTLLETASSTSEDSVSSNDCQSAIRSTAGEMAAGYVSDGDALTAALSGPLAELSTAELTNGYMSEGGISLYARKMQARFREGLEAVRDSMRRQQADLNDRLVLLYILHLSHRHLCVDVQLLSCAFVRLPDAPACAMWPFSLPRALNQAGHFSRRSARREKGHCGCGWAAAALVLSRSYLARGGSGCPAPGASTRALRMHIIGRFRSLCPFGRWSAARRPADRLPNRAFNAPRLARDLPLQSTLFTMNRDWTSRLVRPHQSHMWCGSVGVQRRAP